MRLQLLSCCLLFGLGCSPAATGPAEYPVTGTVTLDGAPIAEGRILFRKIGDGDRGFGAEIKDGKYSLNSEAGKVKIEITAARPVPGKFHSPNGTPEPVMEAIVPAKYNSKTTLEAEVKPSSDNTIPFELTSK